MYEWISDDEVRKKSVELVKIQIIYMFQIKQCSFVIHVTREMFYVTLKFTVIF